MNIAEETSAVTDKFKGAAWMGCSDEQHYCIMGCVLSPLPDQHRFNNRSQQHHISFPSGHLVQLYRFHRVCSLEEDFWTRSTLRQIQTSTRSWPCTQCIQHGFSHFRIHLRLFPRQPQPYRRDDELGMSHLRGCPDLCYHRLFCPGSTRLRWPCRVCAQIDLKLVFEPRECHPSRENNQKAGSSGSQRRAKSP